ncbi:AMP-binding protein [Candidatus Endomicrobiellum agilis]|jgi:acetyl-CoA synthetase|uniref:AMP-binding protein n=1 Tax=Candidatus Endomicrobiellum agilis TaxID=3238957 RepID=UPI002847DE04|nr:AMP-binding protein [Endomicrobium sp.]MDR3092548.1 AMP-binding protein [Endomicrobium sp.]
MLIDKYVKTHYKSYEDFIKNCKIRVPKNFNFAFDVVDEIAYTSPDKKAMVWCNPEGEEKILTFNDIKRESNRAANFLKSLGIKKGDAVMLMLKRHYEYWYCAIALHKLGALMIPATHLLTVKDIKYRVKVANIKMIIAAADKRITDAVDEAKKDLPELETVVSVKGCLKGWVEYYKEIEKFPDDFKRPSGSEAININDKSLLYFTSGTTGMPKMVCHDFSYPLGHIITARFWQNLDAESLHLTVADTGWAKAAWGKIYGQWLCEACIFTYDYERFNTEDLLEKIAKYGVTSFCAPPTIYRHIIKEDISKHDLSRLKYAETAGEPLNPEVFYQFKKMTGLEIKEGFGQTETVVFAATFPWMEVKPGSVGKPSAGWRINIVDGENNSCDTGQEGRLVIRTDEQKPIGLFAGYYKDEVLTKNTWDNGIYDTGDIAYIDEDGYLWFVGRSDDVIKSSGYRIGPFEVESALMEHPCVLECAVTGVPDKERGAVVKATVILAKGYEPSPELVTELQNYVKKATAPYKYPRIVEFVKEIPKTISGKIKRKEIRESGKNK